MISKNLKIQLYRNLIRLVVIHGREVWTLRKSEQNKLFVFERKTLRRIFGLCIDEITGNEEFEKNEELNQLFQLPDIIKETKKEGSIE